MLKFRFPTAKRNTQEQQQQQQQQQQQNESEQEQEHSIPTPSPSPSNSSNYQQQQQNPLTISHPTLIQSTDSVDHTIQNEEHSLPISLSNTNNNTNQRDSTPSSSSHTNVSRKIRRKSYGGLRAMLGINKQDDHQNQSPPPPLPLPPSSACSTSFQHQQLVQQQQHLHRHHKHNPSLDASSSTSSLSNLGPLPSSPAASEPRQTTSSLRPFPFLGGIRRKSANAYSVKPPHPLTTQTNEPLPINYLIPPNSQSSSSSTIVNNNNNKNNKTRNSKIKATDHSARVYGNGSSKKAQSVDDLSQFGLLPKPRIQPRRSEELTEHRPAGPSGSSSASADDTGRARDLHNGLDQIGEIAGSLAAINGASTDDRMPPRLSNPKGMRTVYGVPIEDLYWRDGDSFPLLVDVLVELIEEKGLDQQDEKGVRGVDIWRDSYRDVHNLSGALKLFLREIPGGVIPFDRYDRFLAVNGISDDAERTTQLQSHVKELPLPNKILLLKLIKHFERVVEHAEANSMLAHNVAIVFAPSLFRNGSEHSNPLLSMQNIGKASAIVRHFVMNAAQIFEETSEELLKQAAMETVRAQKEKKQQQGHKRRSINMNLSNHQQQQQRASPQFSNTPTLKPKEDGLQSKRASISSVLTNTTTATTEEHRKSRRGSATLARQKPGNASSSSKRNTARTNSGLSTTTKPAKVNNRHSLTGSILSTSTSKSSKASPVRNSPHSSVASSSILFPPPNHHHTSLPISAATPPDTTTPSTTTTTTTTPHPTLGFSNLTVRKKAK